MGCCATKMIKVLDFIILLSDVLIFIFPAYQLLGTAHILLMLRMQN